MVAFKDKIETTPIGEPEQDNWLGPGYFHLTPLENESLETEEVDLLNTVVPQRIYRIRSRGTFAYTLYLVTQKDVTMQDMLSKLRASDQRAEVDRDIAALARDQAWVIAGWNLPDRGKLSHFDYEIFLGRGSTDMLGRPQVSRLATVLWKGHPNGSLQQLCVFRPFPASH